MANLPAILLDAALPVFLILDLGKETSLVPFGFRFPRAFPLDHPGDDKTVLWGEILDDRLPAKVVRSQIGIRYIQKWLLAFGAHYVSPPKYRLAEYRDYATKESSDR